MKASNPYRGFRFPAAVIEHAVWLYHCFSLSLRDVETILAARGVVVSYESIREWGLRFGRQFANTLKRRRPRPGDKWHMDEVCIRIRGKQHYLWRAVDQDGHVLDVLVQSSSTTHADAAKPCSVPSLPAWLRDELTTTPKPNECLRKLAGIDLDRIGQDLLADIGIGRHPGLLATEAAANPAAGAAPAEATGPHGTRITGWSPS
jgi:hypothetical protein